MKKKNNILMLIAILCMFVAQDASGEEGINWKEDTLTGDWGGSRTRMSEKGLNWEIVYKADLLASISGGIRSGSAYMDNLDVRLEMDGEKAFGWSGGSVLLHVIANQGGKLNASDTGSFMGVDNIETNANTVKLYQAWVEQKLFDDKLSILAGLYDLNSEFYVTDSSAVFIHPVYGIGPELAQTGLNGPSIFPTTSPGIRLKWEPSPLLSLQAVVLDGVPGNPDNPYGTHIRFDSRDGALIVSEISLRPAMHGFSSGHKRAGDYEPISKYSVGLWRYTSRFDDLLATDTNGRPVQQINYGIYAVLEQSLFHEDNDPAQGLAIFLRGGVTRNCVNIADRFVSAGINYKGLVPNRNKDTFGMAFAKAYAGSRHKQAMSDAGTPMEDSEAALEMTYRAQINQWFVIQPDIQLVLNPGFDPNLKDAWVAGSRIEISF